MKRAAAVLLFAIPALADEVPLTVNHNGRLLDGSDQPVEGAHDFTFKIYTLPLDLDPNNPEAPKWTGVYEDVPVTDGLYTVELGATPAYPIPASLFDGSGARWLGITVDAEPEMKPRLRIGSTPHALLAGRALEADHASDADHADVADAASDALRADEADHALTADTATNAANAINATNATNAQHALDADHADIADASSDAQLLGGLAPSHYTNAGNLTGTAPRTVLPLATQSDPGAMSAADKTKLDAVNPAANVTSVTGTAPIQVTSGNAPQVSITNATPSAAGAMSAADKAKLDGLMQIVSGRPGNPATGLFIFNTGNKAFEFWDGTAWASVQARYGFSEFPRSCKDLYDAGAASSGVYSIRPITSEPSFSVYCNMAIEGGGWTLAGKFNLSASGSASSWRVDTDVNLSFLTDTDNDGSAGAGHLSRARTVAIMNAGDKRLMNYVKRHSDQGWRYCTNLYAGGPDSNWSYQKSPGCGGLGWGGGIATCGATSTTCASYDAFYTNGDHWMHANGLNVGTLPNTSSYGGTQVYCGDNCASRLSCTGDRITCYLYVK